ncbi:winged helix-turn-helix domain-containing protein [Burkholderia gladioli]|uniref:winged helix-turn-helix domain-containing protein n=1 Tax=Burkholderia gladioli TaxID=28095 RepID=UPI000BBD1CDE|nr:winged helix-turn-helix domain-containing protein [Burkholderia gladioli]ATF84581.1 hypothetical protein CO712_05610 [Burkholderia gladioli pv. gladioli]
MAERKMHFTARLICECLRDNPGLTAVEVAWSIDVAPKGIKKTINWLIENGYVARDPRTAKGYPMKWTGKRFAPSSEWTVTPHQANLLRARDRRDGRDAASLIVAAVHAMVKVGRAQA